MSEESTHNESESIGSRLSRLRKARGLTQSELAEMIGANKKLISDYEVNRLRLHTDVILSLSAALNVTTDELLGAKEHQTSIKTPARKLIKRMEKIQSFTASQQKYVLRVLDAIIQSIKE